MTKKKKVTQLIRPNGPIKGDQSPVTKDSKDDFSPILRAYESLLELELELIQTQMAQKPMLRAEVGMRVRCANKASAE